MKRLRAAARARARLLIGTALVAGLVAVVVVIAYPRFTMTDVTVQSPEGLERAALSLVDQQGALAQLESVAPGSQRARVPAGRWRLLVSKPGYTTWESTFVLVGGRRSVIAIPALHAEARGLAQVDQEITTPAGGASQPGLVQEGGAETEGAPQQAGEASGGGEGTASETPAPTGMEEFTGHRMEVRLWNIDDMEKVTINGTVALAAEYKRDTGLRDLTEQCTGGPNTVELSLMNRGQGYTYGFQVRIDGKMVLDVSAGEAGRVGANGDDPRMGVVYRTAFVFRRLLTD